MRKPGEGSLRGEIEKNNQVYLMIGLLVLGLGSLLLVYFFSAQPRVGRNNVSGFLLSGFFSVSSGGLHYPSGIAVDENGRVYVTDSAHHRVVVFDQKGRELRSFGQYGSASGQLDYPVGIAVRQGRIWVAELGNARIQVFDQAGNSQGIARLKTPQPFVPTALCLDNQGNLYVVNKAKQEIECFDAQGRLAWAFGGDQMTGVLSFPMGLAVKGNGQVLIADSGNGRLLIYNPATGLVRIVDGGEQRWFSNPRGITVDEQGRVYVAEAMQNTVIVLDEKLQLSARLEVPEELGGLLMPDGIAWARNRLLVIDKGNNRVVQFIQQGG
ncbi:hypothetical protein JDF658_21600 [Carboxydocella sp. JDF658]|nr:hypothetical protein ULO1_10980 [Carboxydocella sp. ULO1]GAW32395.1 hypothetical protein JDF658_21600 [Carboxydocella sp. JDF658]